MSRSSSFLAFDQADGLRRMFAAADVALVVVVANPHVESAGAVLARFAGVYAAQGLNTLVVDAADTAPDPAELAFIDLGACVQPLGPRLAYLAARGLPVQHADAHGSCAGFVPHVLRAVRGVDVVVLHAEARLVARLVGGRDARPVLLASGAGESLTHAYAAIKLMAQRLPLLEFDLLMPTPRGRVPAARQVAGRVGDCAARFLRVALHDWAATDPDMALQAPPGADLLRLAAAQIGVVPPPARAFAGAHPADPIPA